MHPDAELRYIGESVGYGLFARKKITRGTITWVGDELDRHFTEVQLAAMSAVCREQVLRFAYIDRDGIYIMCWDHGRYVNHSCNPNCLSSGFDFEFAIRDIEPGEQLCDEYGLLNLREDLQCTCASPRCRGLIGPADLDRFFGDWDQLVREAFPFIAQADQPLWPLVAEKSHIESVLRGQVPVPSCSVYRLEGK